MEGKLKVNELFSGIGAQHKALERLGIDYEIVGISDIDKYANQSYEAIHGKAYQYGDISKTERLEYADLWTYSFPCIDISQVGKQEGLKKGTHSGLLWEVYRLLKAAEKEEALPKYLVLENVKNLVGEKFKPDFDKWLQTLDELGYSTYWQVMNAEDYGIPQARERVFAVSIKKDLNQIFAFPEAEPLKKKLPDILESEVEEKYYVPEEKARNLADTLAKKQVSNTIRVGGRGSLDRHTWDLVAVDDRVRRLTPLECWRLMGFDDEDFYKAKNSGVSDTQLYKQAGNSIVVDVLAKIFENLLK